MAAAERPQSGNGAFAGFSAQRRVGFAEHGSRGNLGQYVMAPGFAAAARAAELIRDTQEAIPVKPKKKAPSRTEAPSEGFKNIQVKESGPRRIEDTLRRDFVRSSNASLSVTRPMNLLRSSEKYAPSVGADWRKFQGRLQELNGHTFRVLDLAEVALTYVTGEEVMPLVTDRLQKMSSSRRGKDYKWEVGQVRTMVANLNDTLGRERSKEIDAENLFALEYASFADMALSRQLDPEHPRWLEMAIDRAEADDAMPFLDQPLSRWQERFFEVSEVFEGGRPNTFSLVAIDTFDTLKSGRSRLLDMMGDVCGLDVSMIDTDWNPTIDMMETYSGSGWGGRVKYPSIPSPMPLKAPQANNCEV